MDGRARRRTRHAAGKSRGLKHDRLHYPKYPLADTAVAHLPHVINATVESIDAETGEIELVSRFNMAENRAGNQRMFAGRYLHRLRRDGDGFLIARKKVELINCDDRFEIIAVPI